MVQNLNRILSLYLVCLLLCAAAEGVNSRSVFPPVSLIRNTHDALLSHYYSENLRNNYREDDGRVAVALELHLVQSAQDANSLSTI